MTISLCFFFKQKTAYEMRISDWSSDVCSSDLADVPALGPFRLQVGIADEAVGIEAEQLEEGRVRNAGAVAAVEPGPGIGDRIGGSRAPCGRVAEPIGFGEGDGAGEEAQPPQAAPGPTKKTLQRQNIA